MNKPYFWKILKVFLTWRILLFAIAFIASLFIEWGGRFPYPETVLIPTGLPDWIWSFGNFDGVHYLKIAQNGYTANNSQAFFPIYPLLTNLLNFFPKNPTLDTRIFVDPSFFYSGFLLSNIFFFIGLTFFYKLLKIDWSEKVSFGTIIIILLFPTSYYFGSIYTESLFFCSVVSTLYFMRKENYFLASLMAFIASGTKLLGLFLTPILIFEIYNNYQTNKAQIKNKVTKWIPVLIAPLGAIFYMIYLNIKVGDPFYFLSVQPSFGAERSAIPTVLLPQVIFRYMKIFLNVPTFSLSFFNALIEFIFTLIPLCALIFLYKKIRKSYWLLTLGFLIVPTLTGTFSSMPRYALMSFLLFPYLVNSKFFKPILLAFFVLSLVLVTLFTRGFWVA